jgi:SWI/SNF-related matrix-associated actin-dependent regulator of chromatin subfamily D
MCFHFFVFYSSLHPPSNLVAAVGSTSVAIEEIDRDIRKLVEEIIQRKTRRNFFTGFSQSPVDFVSSLVDSQKRDLVTLRDFQESYPTSYSQGASSFTDAHDATIRYLHQKLSSDQM